MTESKSRAIIVHGHIFKNAGTTFDWSLNRNFNADFLDHRDDDVMRLDGASCLANVIEQNPRLKAVASHHLYRWMPMPELPGVTLIPCFFIRHPIERVRSVYTFERKQKSNTPGALHAKKLGFKDYVAWRMDHRGGGVVMNYQIKYCSGRPGTGVTDAFISNTANYLANSALTGIVDRFDESMVYFEEKLGVNFPDIDLSYLRQNVSRKKFLAPQKVEKKVEAVLKELKEGAAVLEKNNRADIELYTLANKALDEQIGKISNFDSKLNDFQQRCKQLTNKA
jgi:hypothetical protein